MKSSSEDAFFAVLKEEWIPFLKRTGFKGHGQRFQRVYGDVIHVIGLQKNKYGGSCCVNLGIHLSFLPLPGISNLPLEGIQVRVESCEFQWRLKPPGYTDYWWAYETGVAAHLPLAFLNEKSSGAVERANHLVKTYELYGEPDFQRLSTVEQIANLIRVEDLAKGYRLVPEYAFTPCRAGLTMARIHHHYGNDDLARRFAKAALELEGRASGLHAELEQLAGEG